MNTVRGLWNAVFPHRSRWTAALLALALLAGSVPALAAGGSLTLTGGPTLTTAQLLQRLPAREIEVAADPAYGPGPRRFLAVPLAPLARDVGVTDDFTLLARAADGFTAQIPGRLVLSEAADQPRAWLAVEPTDRPWPIIANKTASAGPFYVIWERPDANISSRFWIYQVVSLAVARTPQERWPQLRVSASLPADAVERRGEQLFITACLNCHRFARAGDSDTGPDLNRPKSPTEYFQRDALLRFIRDPSAFRTWPGSRMPATAPTTLSDADIEAIVRYMEHKAATR